MDLAEELVLVSSLVRSLVKAFFQLFALTDANACMVLLLWMVAKAKLESQAVPLLASNCLPEHLSSCCGLHLSNAADASKMIFNNLCHALFPAGPISH